jgi:hypothetical protein
VLCMACRTGDGEPARHPAKLARREYLGRCEVS